MHQKPENYTITAYFNGTAHSKHDTFWLANKLHKSTIKDGNSKAYLYDGCGVGSPIGAIFGTGLDKQANQVATDVCNALKTKNHVTLNLFGHSRGALAALLVVLQLQKINPERLSINLLMMDPVPGSLISTARFMDILGIYLANKTMDLTNCENLKNVLVLYPHQPLHSITCHAPQFCEYHPKTNKEEIVIPGCHAGTQYIFDDEPGYAHSLYYAIRFLKEHGSLRKDTKQPSFPEENMIDELIPNRSSHSTTGKYIKTKPNKVIEGRRNAPTYFNIQHKRHVTKNDSELDTHDVFATIERRNSASLIISNFIAKYPAVKWGLIGFAVAAGLVFSGTLATTMPTELALSLLGIIPAVLMTLNYTLNKSGLATKIVDKIAYPHFEIKSSKDTFFSMEESAGKESEQGAQCISVL